MKNKILISLILILLISIGLVQQKISNLSDGNHLAIGLGFDSKETGQVKSAKVEKMIYNLPEIKRAEIAKLPKRKEKSRDPQIWAKNYILMDVTNSYPLMEKDSHTLVPIASTTKIMTALIVLDNYKMDEVVTISQNAATQIGSEINLRMNEKLTVKSLLYALLIKSGNDAAMAFAEHMNPGGVEEFVRKMNKKAEYLGLKDTLFKDPAGLDDTSKSTAFDLAILASYAMRNKDFRSIVKTPEYTITSLDGKLSHELKTSNRLIKSDEPFFLSYATGIKTGFTPEAGHCLIASAEKDSINLVSVILHTNEDTIEASAKESKKLLQWGYDNYNF